MGQLGFSYVGFIYLLMLTIPNLIWTKNQPQGYSPQNENKVLLMFERVGQILVTCFSLIFTDLNVRQFTSWSIWFIVSFLLMLVYEFWWIRYFKSEKTLQDFYSSFLGIPFPGAILPVVAFFLLSIYGKVYLLSIAVIILGIGHIGIHFQHSRELNVNN